MVRSELEQAKKEARELTVQEAVAKNAFEKLSNSGRDKVKLNCNKTKLCQYDLKWFAATL